MNLVLVKISMSVDPHKEEAGEAYYYLSESRLMLLDVKDKHLQLFRGKNPFCHNNSQLLVQSPKSILSPEIVKTKNSFPGLQSYFFNWNI